MEDPERVSKWKVDSDLERSPFLWDFLYYPGCGFLGGTIVGGAKGMLEGLRAAEKGETLKRRINMVLNSGVSAGTRLGRSTGAWGLVYGSVECCVTYLRGGTLDPLNSFVVGFGSAALYESASARSALIAGVIGGITAASVVTGGKLLESTFAQQGYSLARLTGPEKHGVKMSSPDSIAAAIMSGPDSIAVAKKPCLYSILHFTGASYTVGAVAGFAFHFFKGLRNSPSGSHFVVATRGLRRSAPLYAGHLAAFTCLMEIFKCALLYVRQKDDSWNIIIAGAATTGFLNIDLGIGKASLMSLGGGLLFAMVELWENQKELDSMKVGPGLMQEARRDK